MVVLDVECGARKHKGCIGIDLRRVKGVDVIAAATALPFKDNCFDKIILSHIVEHSIQKTLRPQKEKALIYVLTLKGWLIEGDG